MKPFVFLSFFIPLAFSLRVSIPSAPSNPSDRVPPFFSSLAVEYFAIRDLFLVLPYQPPPTNLADLPKRINLAAIQLLRNLGQINNADPPLIFRIGGNSATEMWIRGSSLPRLPQQEAEIDAYEYQILDAVANLTGVKFIIAVGMPTSTPIYLSEVLTLIKNNLKSSNILAIQVGNEPDHFTKKGLRDASYTPDQYFAEYDVYAAQVRSVFPDIPLMGPNYAYPWRDAGYHIPFIQKKAGVTKYMSFHRYALRGCATSNSLDMLLDDPLSSKYQWISDITAATKATNTFNVWAEGGTASCSGVTGISDVFGSALWTVDMMFEAAYRGVYVACMAGAPQATYAPFTFSNTALDVRGTYYGMMLMRTVIRNNTVVYRPSVDVSSLRLKTWAAYDSGTREHTIVVVHKNTDPDATVIVSMPSGSGKTGQVIYLTAPAITAVNGMSIAGLKFDGSVDGLPLNSTSYSSTIVNANSDGSFTFTAKQGSVTLLKVYPSGETPALIDLSYTADMNQISAQGGGRRFISPGSGTNTSSGESFKVGIWSFVGIFLSVLCLDLIIVKN